MASFCDTNVHKIPFFDTGVLDCGLRRKVRETLSESNTVKMRKISK